MKVTMFQETIAKTVSFVSKLITTKTQLPILSNVLLQTDKGQLKISATNLDTSMSFWIGAIIEEEGAITIPAHILNDLIASLPKDKVVFETKQTILILRSGESEATIAGIDATEFPPLPMPRQKYDALLPFSVFNRGLPFVAIATSHDEGRPLLTGIRFAQKNDYMVMVATDGYRLSIKDLPLLTGLESGFIIPGRALMEVYRIAAEEKVEEAKLFFSKDSNQIIFSLGDAQIATRLIEGEYPPYEKIIPASSTTRVIFSVVELTHAIKLASVFARESANIVKFYIEGNTALISANSPQLGENKTTLTVKTEGEGGDIAFNIRFLQDLLSVFPEEELVFEMSGPLAPGVFKTQKDPSYLHIIMPVRIQT